MREAVVILPTTHPLCSPTRQTEIKKNIKLIITHIDRILGSVNKNFDFKLTEVLRVNRTIPNILSEVLSKSRAPKVRLIYTNTPLSKQDLKDSFENNLLLVSMNDANSQFGLKGSLAPSNGCHINIAPSDAGRIIEDLFVDIYIAQFMSATTLPKQYIQSHGLESFYNKKALFFQRNKNRAWLSSISKDTGYAPLSSICNANRSDFENRANEAAKNWKDFCNSLSLNSLTGEIQNDLNLPIERLNKYGGLPLKKIKLQAKSLPDGLFIIPILRKSATVRKSPKYRGKVKAIFGRKRKIGSFRIMNRENYYHETKVISGLLKEKAVLLLHVTIQGDAITINKLID